MSTRCPFISLLRTRKIEQAAQLSFGERNTEDFWLPYFCVSTNLTTAAMVVHDRGPAWLATRASGSLPGIALPVVLGNQLLVDGGVINNVPADVMRQRWNGAVVAVNVSPREDLSFNLSAFPSPWRLLWDRLLGRAPSTAPTILNILMRTTMLASVNHSAGVVGAADLYLQPPISGFGMLQFDSLPAIVEVGHRYAREHLPAWWNGGRALHKRAAISG